MLVLNNAIDLLACRTTESGGGGAEEAERAERLGIACDTHRVYL